MWDDRSSRPVGFPLRRVSFDLPLRPSKIKTNPSYFSKPQMLPDTISCARELQYHGSIWMGFQTWKIQAARFPSIQLWERWVFSEESCFLVTPFLHLHWLNTYSALGSLTDTPQLDCTQSPLHGRAYSPSSICEKIMSSKPCFLLSTFVSFFSPFNPWLPTTSHFS